MDRKWTFDQIDQLVKENSDERQTLDFKHPAALQSKKVGKIVSAFANASGGTVIYGVRENKDANGNVDSLEYVPIERDEFSAEWLHQKINGNMEGGLPGIEIDVVPMPDDPSKILAAVRVPQSETAHQYTEDRCYYRRYGDQCLKMYHHEIVDVLNRAKHPDIDLILCFRNSHDDWSLHIYAENTGAVLARFVKVEIDIPSKLRGDTEFETDTVETYVFRNTERDVVDVEVVPGGIGPSGFPKVYRNKKYGPSWFDPLMPKEHVELGNLTVREDFQILANQEVGYRIYADNAAPKTGRRPIGEIEVLAK